MTHDHHRLHQMLKRQIVECITYLLCQYPIPPIPTTYVYIVYLLYPIPIISIFKSHTYHVYIRHIPYLLLVPPYPYIPRDYINHIPYLICIYQTYPIPTIGISISHTYLETISTISHACYVYIRHIPYIPRDYVNHIPYLPTYLEIKRVYFLYLWFERFQRYQGNSFLRLWTKVNLNASSVTRWRDCLCPIWQFATKTTTICPIVQ